MVIEIVFTAVFQGEEMQLVKNSNNTIASFRNLFAIDSPK